MGKNDNIDALNAVTQFPIHEHWGTRINFKPELFDVAIQQSGIKVMWEQGMFCSCISRDSGQPDYSCVSCQGAGYLYFDPKITKAVISSISGRKEQDKIGLNELGVAYITTLSTDDVGFRDRFTFVDFKTKFSEIIVRGDQDTPDMLSYESLSVIEVRVLNQSLIKDVDYTVVDKEVTWLTDAVPTGTRYSILYNVRPVYIVTNPIHELRGTYTMAQGHGEERFVVLPKQFQIKRVDFLDQT